MQKRYLPAMFFFVVLLVLLAHFGGRLSAVPAMTYAEEQKSVYLTFDDGPSTIVTGKILDVFKQEKIKATFFIVSDRVSGRKETLRRIAAEGHTLGVHSKSHVYSEIYSSEKAFLHDVDSCANVITQTTGVIPHVYRFPGGGFQIRKKYTELLEHKGYRVIGWNAVCGDEEIPNASAETLYKTAVKTSQGKKKVVLLLHDSAARKATAEALPEIIAHYRENGYVFRAF